MPARDIYHNNVKNALIKDKWLITHDPLTLKFGKKDMYVYLGAKQLLAAQKVECKIASDRFAVYSSVLNTTSSYSSSIGHSNSMLDKVTISPTV
ncbi:MAG: XisH family protein [Komarekiella atlantica HA4396-MV6]|nr:XisH family protein [Komarekiella atlantica HA4396-MV6]